MAVFGASPCDPTAAELAALFGLYARLAFLSANDANDDGEPEAARERELAARQLLFAQGAAVGASDRRWLRLLDASRSELQDLSEARNEELQANLLRRERTQRAMLNVIEDLREARAGLEAKVRERTRDLAAANAMLRTRNQDLEEFAYIASHDLQEPLRTISGYLQMIARRYKGRLDSDADEFIDFATDGAARMQALLESLLVYSRVTMKLQDLRPTRLDRALDSAIENLRLAIEESRAQIEREPLPEVVADPVQMVQLFQNLLGNAIKFHGTTAPRIRVTAARTGAHWTLRVHDEGIGIAPRYAERIFKVFRRLHREMPGTGVGLAICKKIVERHGGAIGVESTPGKGSTFHFTLPVEPLEDEHA